jgi:hypothetical protein
MVDPDELGLALDVEGEDPRLEGEADLGVGLADAPAACTRRSSPPLTKSNAEPRLAKCLTTAKFEFALSE